MTEHQFYRVDILHCREHGPSTLHIIGPIPLCPFEHVDLPVTALSLHPMPRPKIVCLCGSTRFYKEFQEANVRETAAGYIVLTVAFWGRDEHGHIIDSITPEQKALLDEVYFRKVELADEILVINVGGFIGESTTKEIAHAKALGKSIRYWETSCPR